MQYTTTILLGNENINRLLSDEQQLLIFFNHHRMVIQNLLMDYWFRRRGAVDSLSLLLGPLCLDGAMGGTLVVHYKVLFSFACEDSTSTTNERMTLTFVVGRDQRDILISGEDERERVDEL
jgi:hypothetical protein